MFAIDSAMHVTQDAYGTVRMIESGVPTDVLNIKIREVRFERPESYYPNAAFDRLVFHAPEFKQFFREHGISWDGTSWPLDVNVRPGLGFSALGNPNPLPEWPHLSGSLHDISVAELLDYIVGTFPGIWIYENCPQEGTRVRTVWLQTVHYKYHGSDILVLQ